MRLKSRIIVAAICAASLLTTITAETEMAFGAPSQESEHPLTYKRAAGQAAGAQSPGEKAVKPASAAATASSKSPARAPASATSSSVMKLSEVLSVDVVEKIAPVAANMPLDYRGDGSVYAASGREGISLDGPDYRQNASGAAAVRMGRDDTEVSFATLAEGALRVRGDASGIDDNGRALGNTNIILENSPDAVSRGGVYLSGNISSLPGGDDSLSTAALHFNATPARNLTMNGDYMTDKSGANSMALRFAAAPLSGVNVRGDLLARQDLYGSSRITNLAVDATSFKPVVLRGSYSGQSFNDSDMTTAVMSLETSPEFAARSRLVLLGRYTSWEGTNLPSQQQTEIYLNANPFERLRIAGSAASTSSAAGWEWSNNRLRADYDFGKILQLGAETGSQSSGGTSQQQNRLDMTLRPGNGTEITTRISSYGYADGGSYSDKRTDFKTGAGKVGIYGSFNEQIDVSGESTSDRTVGLYTAIGRGLEIAADRRWRTGSDQTDASYTGLHVRGRLAGNLEASSGMEWADGYGGSGGGYVGLTGQPLPGVVLSYKRRLQADQAAAMKLPLSELSLTSSPASSAGDRLQLRGGISYLQQETGAADRLNADLGLVYNPSANLNLSASYRADVSGGTERLSPYLELKGEAKWEF